MLTAVWTFSVPELHDLQTPAAEGHRTAHAGPPAAHEVKGTRRQGLWSSFSPSCSPLYVGTPIALSHVPTQVPTPYTYSAQYSHPGKAG